MKYYLLSAAVVLIAMTACQDNVIPENHPEDEYVVVGLNCVGEILDFEESPLTKASDDEHYYIQAYSLEYQTLDNGDVNIVETPYAHGHFSSIDGLTIRLQSSKKYKFKVAVSVGSFTNDSTPNMETGGLFNYTTSLDIFSDLFRIGHTNMGYYGELDQFSLKESSSVNVNLKRISYGAKFVAEDLTEGTLRVKVTNGYLYTVPLTYDVMLTPSLPISDEIYTFVDYYQAWKGILVDGEYTDYAYTSSIEITWQKDGENIPLGQYNVTFKRNVRTTIRIKVKEPMTPAGVSITREESEFTENENQYVIEDGVISEEEVTQEKGVNLNMFVEGTQLEYELKADVGGFYWVKDFTLISDRGCDVVVPIEARQWCSAAVGYDEDGNLAVLVQVGNNPEAARSVVISVYKEDVDVEEAYGSIVINQEASSNPYIYNYQPYVILRYGDPNPGFVEIVSNLSLEDLELEIPEEAESWLSAELNKLNSSGRYLIHFTSKSASASGQEASVKLKKKDDENIYITIGVVCE